jgi:hypothetical protein
LGRRLRERSCIDSICDFGEFRNFRDIDDLLEPSLIGADRDLGWWLLSMF